MSEGGASALRVRTEVGFGDIFWKKMMIVGGKSPNLA